MHGVKYVWNGKVFKQNQVSIETKRFKVDFSMVVISHSIG